MVKKIDRKAEKDKRHLRVRKKISGTEITGKSPFQFRRFCI